MSGELAICVYGTGSRRGRQPFALVGGDVAAVQLRPVCGIHPSMTRVFIVGCGYVGTRLAQEWLRRGAAVAALARSDTAAARLQRLGISPVAGDLGDVWSLRRLALRDSLLYYLAPPPPSGVADTWMRCFVSALRTSRLPGRCVLLGTTGVYGDHRGGWIDENAELRPGSDRSRRRLDAERVLRAWGRVWRVPVVVLRVAGIYGPERLPLQRLRAGAPLVREQECPFTNRIHVDDLVAACVAAGERGRADNVYNVSDGDPCTMTAYFNSVADAVGLPRPPQVPMRQARQHMTPAMLAYLAESRRLCNHKLVQELGLELRYPTLAEGLGAICEHKKKG